MPCCPALSCPTVLTALVSDLDALDEAGYGAVEGCLTRLGELVAEDLLDYVTDRWGAGGGL
jgi:hypothetical protein